MDMSQNLSKFSICCKMADVFTNARAAVVAIRARAIGLSITARAYLINDCSNTNW